MNKEFNILTINPDVSRILFRGLGIKFLFEKIILQLPAAGFFAPSAEVSGTDS